MLTEQEYKHWRKIADNYMDWVKAREYRGYKPDELPEELRSLTNEIRSQIEVYEWVNDPPEEYFAYVKNDSLEVTTWMGDRIGNFFHTGHHYEDVEQTYLDENDEEVVEYERQEVRDIYVIGTNGVTYIGKYYFENGDYCTMEKSDE